MAVRRLLMHNVSVGARTAGAAHSSGRTSTWLASPLRRVEWLLDESQVSRSAGATRIRLIIGSLFLVYGAVLEAIAVQRGDVQLGPICFVLGSLPILLSRLGRLGRYFIPVALGLYAYSAAGSYVLRFKLGVHYAPQIRAEQLLAAGTTPTIWLQQHLYHGVTGPLEIFCVVAYLGHFVVPLALGAALALSDRAREFKLLMFGILTVAVLGAITFVAAPTAPPWLAAQHGYLSGVHHILKQSLDDLHMTSLGAMEGDASKYDVTAAVPSLHAAFPLVCLLVALWARLPRLVIAALGADLVAVVFAIVYMGEHYLIDALAGLAYAALSMLLVRVAIGAGADGRAASQKLDPASPGPRVHANGDPGQV